MAINTVFLWGVGGGIFAEVLKWWQLRESDNFPTYAKRPFYWIITIFMVLAGGLIAYLQGDANTKPLLALNIGMSAQIILKSLATSVPKLDTTRGLSASSASAKPSALNFLAGR
jgi:hypothetical protein